MDTSNQDSFEQLKQLAQMLKDRHSKPFMDQNDPPIVNTNTKSFSEEDFLPNIMQVTPEANADVDQTVDAQ